MNRKWKRLALAALAIGMAAWPARAATRGVTDRPEGGELPSCVRSVDASAPNMVVCDAGGDGAHSCETGTTVSISGFGYVSSCGISCNTGTYACCQQATVWKTASCSCQPYPPRGPYAPFTPVTPDAP